MDAAVTINSTVGRKLTVRVSFTSPLMRDPDFDSGTFHLFSSLSSSH